MPPVRNHDVGQRNSRKRRGETARVFADQMFVRMIAICDWEGAQTLQGIADHLNAFGFKTIRGEHWSAGNVHRILKKKGLTAKQLHERVHTPTPYEKTAAQVRFARWPVETHRALGEAERRLIEENGEWVSALLYEPKRAPGRMRVRHKQYGEGQIWGALSSSRYLCSFIDWDEGGIGSFEVECAASELDVWRYRLSPEERDALRERLKARFLR